MCLSPLLARFGTKRVLANRVYQEYIQDKNHLHMNATRWVTLTEFVKHLGRTSVARVDETEKGWFIAWIDNSPKALAKAVCIIIYSRRSCHRSDSPDRFIMTPSPLLPAPQIGCEREEGTTPSFRRAART